MDKISVDRLCSEAVKRAKAEVKYSQPNKDSGETPASDTRLKRVFICSPFRATGETEKEKAKSRRYNDWLVRFSCRYAVSNGFIPYAPHLYCPSFLDDDDKGERGVGLFIGKLWMMQCDEVWVIGRIETEGMKAEIEMAKQWKIPIKHYIPARSPEERLIDAIFTPYTRYIEMALEDSCKTMNGRYCKCRCKDDAVESKANVEQTMEQNKLNDPNQTISNQERKDLAYILGRIELILKDDKEAQEIYIRLKGLEDEEMPCPHSNQYLNTQCEFFDIDSNRIQCAIGWDMYRCNRRCLFATNTPGSLPPYGTKYMKGRL